MLPKIPRSRYKLLRVLLCLGVLLSASTGCLQLSSSKPSGPWHEAYEPINDPASEAYISECLERAIAEFGEPIFPVNKVLLRRSIKTHEARRYRIGEGFSLTECVDPTNGVFVIYLAVGPEHHNYFALLGHECAHLLNPYLFDWYIEGLATLFSEQMCEETGREWGDWKRHFERTRREPYGLSYRMMRELKEEFPNEYSSIIQCTADSKNGADRRHIDIDAWIETLPPDRSAIALDIISKYSHVLEKATSEQYYFKPPAD